MIFFFEACFFRRAFGGGDGDSFASVVDGSAIVDFELKCSKFGFSLISIAFSVFFIST